MVASIVDRIINVEQVCLCPQMDLVALVMRGGTLVINRTTSWQRLMTQVDTVAAGTGAISALCWSPDGQRLAVGHCHGALSVFDVETGALAYDLTCRTGIGHAHRISLVWWVKQNRVGTYLSNRSIADFDSARLTVVRSAYID